jgi:hypothetical protein
MEPPIGDSAAGATADARIVSVEIQVDELAGRLTREAKRLAADARLRGLTGEALANDVRNGLNRLSDVLLEKQSREAAGSEFNAGRNIEIQKRAEEIANVVRTAILDKNTCGPCGALDGSTYEVNTDAYHDNHPPRKCDGREMCRCFYMPVAA